MRPLFDDGSDNPSAVTRDYVLTLDMDGAGAPLLSVYGGKITTYRRLAEEAVGKVGAVLGRAGTPWTATAPLPGGDFSGGLPALDQAFAARHPWLPAALRHRLLRAYGTETEARFNCAMSPNRS